MPEREDCRITLDAVTADVRDADGTALVVRLEEPNDGNFVALFDRSADFANLLGDITIVRDGLSPDTANETLKQVRKLRKGFANLATIDFFPGEAQKQADEALRDLEQRAVRRDCPVQDTGQASESLRQESTGRGGRRV